MPLSSRSQVAMHDRPIPMPTLFELERQHREHREALIDLGHAAGARGARPAPRRLLRCLQASGKDSDHLGERPALITCLGTFGAQ